MIAASAFAWMLLTSIGIESLSNSWESKGLMLWIWLRRAEKYSPSSPAAPGMELDGSSTIGGIPVKTPEDQCATSSLRACGSPFSNSASWAAAVRRPLADQS